MKIIELIKLSKTYKFLVLNNINYSFKKGKTYLIVGDNGSGKTTLIKLIIGLTYPSSGIVLKKSNNISYIPDGLAFPDFLTVRKFLYDLGLIYGIKVDRIDSIIKNEIDFWGLDGNYKLKELSKGMRQKVLIVQAMLKDGMIYIFDEPLNGLDVEMKEMFFSRIKELKDRGKTIIIITHQLDEFRLLSDYILRIVNGIINEESS